MSRSLKIEVVDMRFQGGGLSINVNHRLQRWGTDKTLFANNDFKAPEEDSSPLLDKLLELLRTDQYPVDRLIVRPFNISIYDSSLTQKEVAALMRKAAKEAGLSLYRPRSTRAGSAAR